MVIEKIISKKKEEVFYKFKTQSTIKDPNQMR